MQFKILKKAASLFLAAALAFGAVMPSSAAIVEYKIGDMDYDGKLTVSDVVAMRGAIMNSTDDNLVIRVGDINTDGKLTVSDVVELRRFIMDDKNPGSFNGFDNTVLAQKSDVLMSSIKSEFYSAGASVPNETLDEGSATAYLWPYTTYVESLSQRYRVWRDESSMKDYISALEQLEQYRATRDYIVYAPTLGGSGTVYYDDNALVTLSLIDAYELLEDKAYLEKAEQLIQYCYSGMAENGGAWWNEDDRSFYPTCSIAPISYASSLLYKITGKTEYLSKAKTLYNFAQTNLINNNGLYINQLNVDGTKDANSEFVWSYNSGEMLCAGVALYEITSDESYLENIKKTVGASEYGFGEYNWNGYTFYSGAPWFISWLLRGCIAAEKYYPAASLMVDNIQTAVQNGIDKRNGDFVNKTWDKKGSADATVSLIDQAGTASTLYLLQNEGKCEIKLHETESQTAEYGVKMLNSITDDFYSGWMFKENLEEDGTGYLWSYSAYLDALFAYLDKYPDDDYAMRALKTAMQRLTSYRSQYNGDVCYAPVVGGTGDFYFDDNGLVIQEYIYAYRLTGNTAYLNEAKAIAEFEYNNGWNDILGGIWWNVGRRDFSATCATTLLAYVSSMLYEETGEQKYLDWTNKLYNWTNENLLDVDGLYINQLNVDGSTSPSSLAKWTYTQGYMISTGVNLYKITGNISYLSQAKITIDAADSKLGAINKGVYSFYTSEPWFHSCLAEAYVNYFSVKTGGKSEYYGHINSAVLNGISNPKSGVYVNRSWDKAGTDRDSLTTLLDQCGTASVLFIMDGLS